MFKFFRSNFLIVLILSFATILRLYQLSSIPPSLFGDEMDLGYQAYSISKTGRDYQGNFMPLHFHSLAEWRTPLYLYSAVPTVALFGISPLGVRLPAVIYGVLSILGFYLLVRQITKDQKLATLGGFFLAISPWHLQYSRAGFEVTMLLCFLLFGLYFFFSSIKEGKYLWISLVLLILTPLIYSTAKLFTPLLIMFLLFVYKKDLLELSKRSLFLSLGISIVVGIIVSYAVLFSGGSQRFNYISVFSDPTTEPEIGTARLNDARARGEMGAGLTPSFIDRVVHNKFVYWGQRIENNFLQAISGDFLFLQGDPNPRHMMDGFGMFYRIDALLLLAGICFFFLSKDLKLITKIFIVFWIVVGIIPSAITRDGGNHATRLILILPPLMFLISYGFVSLNKYLKLFYVASLLVGFSLYMHSYYSHFRFASERWWHYGWKDAVSEVKKLDKDYDKVIITMADEPAWIFFAGGYEYDPHLWQSEFPIGNDIELNGFGKVSHTNKFFFGSPQGGIYELEKVIDSKTLYLASAKEVAWNLIMDPSKTPNGLKLLKPISYPSGEPAFYIFTKNDQ